MEWLAANAVNIITALIMICGGIAFAGSLDRRLESIEKEQGEIKNVIVVSARLEERIKHINEMVMAQGKRLDWMTQRFYGKKDSEENSVS